MNQLYKRGISLIALVITIIVLLILVGAVILFSRSVTITYGGKTTPQAITVKQGILADLITGPAEYGYSVSGYTANGVSAWSVFYEDTTNGYVFLISTNNLGNQSLTLDDATGVTTANNSSVYKIFKLGASGYTLNSSYNNSKAVAYLVNDFGTYASPTNSKITSYVVGAIGGPTIELFAAAYKAKVGTNIPIGTITYGYTVNGIYYQSITNDGFYCNDGYSYWLASPSYCSNRVMHVGGSFVGNDAYRYSYGLRPIVCLKSDISATISGTTITLNP